MGGKNANISGTDGELDLVQYMIERYNVKEEGIKRAPCTKNKKPDTKVVEISGTYPDTDIGFSFSFQKCLKFPYGIGACIDMYTEWVDNDTKVVKYAHELKNQNGTGSVTEKIYKQKSWVDDGWLEHNTVLTNNKDHLKHFEDWFKKDPKLNGRLIIARRRDWDRYFDSLDKCIKERKTKEETIEEMKKFNAETPEYQKETNTSEPKQKSTPNKTVEDAKKSPTESKKSSVDTSTKAVPKKQNKKPVQQVEEVSNDENDENVAPAV